MNRKNTPTGSSSPHMAGGAEPPASAVRPVLVTSPSMLAAARAHGEAGIEPQRTAWEKTLARAIGALEQEFVPYQEKEYLRYYRTGREQAQYIRDLALAWHLTGDRRFAVRGRELLREWAEAFHRAYDFPDHYPACEIAHAAGLVIGRTILIFADAYALLFEELGREDHARVRSWLRELVRPIKESLRLWEIGEYWGMQPPFFGQQYFNNHLGACTMGIAAIGFALRDRELIAYAIPEKQQARTRPYGEVDQFNLRDLRTLIDGAILMPGEFGSGTEYDVLHGNNGDPSLHGAPPPLPGEIYDRYRVREGKGTHYALLHLRLLTLMAEMAHNNLGTSHYPGPDYYRYVGSHGENLRISFELYAEWFITMDPASVNNGYYVDWIGEGGRRPDIEQDLDSLAIFELARVRYPESERIAAAIEARERAGQRHAFDAETFAWTAPLLYGD